MEAISRVSPETVLVFSSGCDSRETSGVRSKLRMLRRNSSTCRQSVRIPSPCQPGGIRLPHISICHLWTRPKVKISSRMLTAGSLNAQRIFFTLLPFRFMNYISHFDFNIFPMTKKSSIINAQPVKTVFTAVT
ncbi:hypothetical protein SDC9_157349 [bioreactor metagenome]|uniref:Uncharacterized protein n=1 Tax=bioreactor metagenome TaxID=1076179 RepID=A0A645F8V7_9ZZZZ